MRLYYFYEGKVKFYCTWPSYGCASAFLCTCVHVQEYCIHKLHITYTWPSYIRFTYVYAARIVPRGSFRFFFLVCRSFRDSSSFFRPTSRMPKVQRQVRANSIANSFVRLHENGLASSIAVVDSLERRICVESSEERRFLRFTTFYKSAYAPVIDKSNTRLVLHA